MYPGDTMIAKSVTRSKRLSAKHNHMGIITWHTTGWNQLGEMVIEFNRSNLVNFGHTQDGA
jgi:acyl dehydratase